MALEQYLNDFRKYKYHALLDRVLPSACHKRDVVIEMFRLSSACCVSWRDFLFFSCDGSHMHREMTYFQYLLRKLCAA